MRVKGKMIVEDEWTVSDGDLDMAKREWQEIADQVEAEHSVVAKEISVVVIEE